MLVPVVTKHTNFQKISGVCTANMQSSFLFGCDITATSKPNVFLVMTPDLEHLNIFLKSHDYEISDNCIEKVKVVGEDAYRQSFCKFHYHRDAPDLIPCPFPGQDHLC